MTCLNRSRYVWSEYSRPNISGSTARFNGINYLDESKRSGAFRQSVHELGNATWGGQGGGAVATFVFNAKDSNALYDGSTNQPAAGLTLLCIKS